MSFTIDNNVRVELTAAIGTGANSVTVSKAVAPNRDPPSPAPGFPGLITLVDRLASPTKIEILQYTGRADNGATWTLTGLTRGTEGTSAQTWGAGTIAYQALTAAVLGSKANTSGVPEVRIAVIGDSLATQNMLMSEPWPVKLETLLRQSGVDARVHNCSQSSGTFFRAANVAAFGANTPLQQAVSFKPHIVIVSLGFNDTVTAIDGRSLAQVQADADALFASLASSLPTALILYAGERSYDATNFPTPGTTLKNKGTIGYNFQLPTSGILQGLYSFEILEDSVSATTQSRLADWISLNSYAAANANIDGSCVIDYFRIHRAGGAMEDSLHITEPGCQIAAGYVIAALRNAPFDGVVPRIRAALTAARNDPDAFFLDMFTQSGDGWTWDGGVSSDSVLLSLHGSMRPDTWYMPRDIKLSSSNLTTNLNVNAESTVDFIRVITGLRPGESISTSVNGAAFSGATTVGYNGNFIGTSPGMALARNFGYGTHTFRYKVDNMSLGPVTFTVVDQTNDNVSAPASRDLLLSDTERMLSCAAGTTLTIPPQASVAWYGKSEIRFYKASGTGSVVIAPGAGVTLRVSDGGLPRISSDFEVGLLKRIAENEWLLTKIGGSDPRVIPVRLSNAATNFAQSDRGNAVRKSDTGAYTWTIPTDATAGWEGNASILACNDGSSGNVTIAPAGGVTLTAGTTTGSFTLAPGESRLLHRVDANNWRVR